MFDKIFKHNIKNEVIIFTDTLKTKSIAKFYKNAKCIMTENLIIKILVSFIMKI